MVKRVAKYKKYLLAPVGMLILCAAGVGLWAGYAHDNSWTGFLDRAVKVGPDQELEHGKTLWDWLDLLIIPAVLAGGVVWINRRNQQTEREIAANRTQDEALQSYMDRMSDLLLKEGLRKSKHDDEVRTVAGARTLTVLRGLDGERKGTVIRFLSEAHLVQRTMGIDGNVPAVLSLEGANLQGAKLRFASLQGANLMYANLQEAYLRIADFEVANLMYADLQKADLTGTGLQGANLLNTIFRGANLDHVFFDERTILPDGTKWTPGTDLTRFTNPATNEPG